MKLCHVQEHPIPAWWFSCCSTDTKAYNTPHITPCSGQPSENHKKLIQAIRKRSGVSLWPLTSCKKQRNLGCKSPNHERRSAKSSGKDTQYTRAIYSAAWHHLPVMTSISWRGDELWTQVFTVGKNSLVYTDVILWSLLTKYTWYKDYISGDLQTQITICDRILGDTDQTNHCHEIRQDTALENASNPIWDQPSRLISAWYQYTVSDQCFSKIADNKLQSFIQFNKES